MSKPRKNPRKVSNLLLAAHLFVYLIAWCLALYSLSALPIVGFTSDHTHFIGAVMLWLPILVLHVSAHLSSKRQINSVEIERQAYRDGFADAMHELESRRDVIDRLALSDDGELVGIIEKPKRDQS